MSGKRKVHLVGGSYDGATITVPSNWFRLDLLEKPKDMDYSREAVLALRESARWESYAPLSADDLRRNIWTLCPPLEPCPFDGLPHDGKHFDSDNVRCCSRCGQQTIVPDVPAGPTEDGTE